MVPESWGKCYRLISVILQVIFKSVICKYSILWKNIHTLLNTYIDFYIMWNVSEVVFIDNLLGFGVKGQFHVFVKVHWCVEIKVWYVCTQKYGVRCWYGAVDDIFSCCDIWRGSFDFTGVLNYIYSNSKYCSVGFIFLWFDVTEYSSICHFLILWDLLFWNGDDCFWSRKYVAHTFCKYA